MKYNLNQNVFTMDSDKPAMRKVTGVAMIAEGNFYVLSKKGEENAKLSTYDLYISDTKLKWIKEDRLFETLDLLQKNLFGDIK